MKKRILQTIKKNRLIEEEMHVILGLSGGPDSVCLFDVLCQLAEELHFKIHAVHVNHMFRPGAAEEDQKYVEDLCRERNVECRSFVVDCSRVAEELGMTSEEAGRKVRYESFRAVADEIVRGGVAREKVAIAVAQNADDQCETVLFRIMRGTGVDGLAGIAYKRWDEDGNAVIRPLLDATRVEIEAYCEKMNLNPRIDHTNQQEIYTRNKIRLSLIPYIKENFNENILETVNRLAAAAAQDRDFIQKEAEQAYEIAAGDEQCKAEQCPSKKGLDVEYVRGLHGAVRTRVFNMALKDVGLAENVTAAHLEGIERVLFTESPSALYDLPEGYRAARKYDRLVFEKVQIKDGSSACVRRGVWGSASSDGAPSDCIGIFSAAAIEEVYGPDYLEKIEIRKRQPGDFMFISMKDGLHRKKIQDMLVDMKIPKLNRDELMMAAIGKEILCILPNPQAGLEKPRLSAAYKMLGTEGETIIYLDNL